MSSITTTSALIVYISVRQYKDAFTSSLCRLSPQLVAASAARPRHNPLRGSLYRAGLSTAILWELRNE